MSHKEEIQALLERSLQPVGPFAVSLQLFNDVMSLVTAMEEGQSSESHDLQEQANALAEDALAREAVIEACTYRLLDVLPRLREAAEVVADIPDEKAHDTFLWRPSDTQGLSVRDLRTIVNTLAELSDT